MKIFKTLSLLYLCFFSTYLCANERIEKSDVKLIDTEINKSLSKNNSNNDIEVFIRDLQIKQGIASFIQKKHFTFLNNPIVSKGLLKIHQNSVIWQVNTPVFSKLIIVGDQVWQQISKDDSQNKTPVKYQKIVSHASVETLIRTVFTGEINRTKWNVLLNEQQCLQLLPKDLILSQAIQKIAVCVPDDKTQRFVTLTDAQSNLTEIELNILTHQLSGEDLREFNIRK